MRCFCEPRVKRPGLKCLLWPRIGLCRCPEPWEDPRNGSTQKSSMIFTEWKSPELGGSSFWILPGFWVVSFDDGLCLPTRLQNHAPDAVRYAAEVYTGQVTAKSMRHMAQGRIHLPPCRIHQLIAVVTHCTVAIHTSMAPWWKDLYADRHIQVLVSTATLAWGEQLRSLEELACFGTES